jgi:hypothetical protein
MQLQKRRLQGDPNHPRATKTEAAYFIAEGGRRTGILILNMNDASELPRIAEPWFLALNASIEATPAMIPEDLQRAAPAIAPILSPPRRKPGSIVPPHEPIAVVTHAIA